MAKMLVQIGEDGSGLGWTRVCEGNEQKLQEQLSAVQNEFYNDMTFSGIIFVVDEKDSWYDEVMEEAKELNEKEATFDEVVAKVKDAIDDEIYIHSNNDD